MQRLTVRNHNVHNYRCRSLLDIHSPRCVSPPCSFCNPIFPACRCRPLFDIHSPRCTSPPPGNDECHCRQCSYSSHSMVVISAHSPSLCICRMVDDSPSLCILPFPHQDINIRYNPCRMIRRFCALH